MNYEVLLSRSEMSKINGYDQSLPDNPAEIEEHHHNALAETNDTLSAVRMSNEGGSTNSGGGGTPARKIATFLNSLTLTSSGTIEDDDASGATNEIKGRVESKLISMWHNVKYGKFNDKVYDFYP